MTNYPTEKDKAGRPSANSTNVSEASSNNNTIASKEENNPSSGRINWLNGSYSGADIKVIAHLYGKVDKDKELKKIQEEIDYCNAFKKMCETFLSNLPSIESAIPSRNVTSTLDQLEEYLRVDVGYISGGDSPEARAYADFKGSNFNPYIEWMTSRGKDTYAKTILIQNCDDFYTSCDQLLKNYEEQKKDFQDIAKNSSTTLSLGTLQTISLSTHREKMPVFALGRGQVSSFTRGPRTIGGSMIFTLFEEHPLRRLIRAMDSAQLYGETSYNIGLSNLIPDQLPPVDLTIVFANEYGSLSKLGIYGVEFINDGLTMSIEDIFSEQVLNFVARDIDIMTHVGLRKLSSIEKQYQSRDSDRPLTGSDLYYSDMNSYNNYLERLDSRLKLVGR